MNDGATRVEMATGSDISTSGFIEREPSEYQVNGARVLSALAALCASLLPASAAAAPAQLRLINLVQQTDTVDGYQLSHRMWATAYASTSTTVGSGCAFPAVPWHW